MKRLKKFWLALIAAFPFAAGAATPWVFGGLAGVGALAGFSVYRSLTPVDMTSAMNFFSSCWSCQMFSDVIFTISDLMAPIYSAIGLVIIPMCLALTAIWFAWRLLAGYIGQGKVESAWNLSGNLGVHILKMSFVSVLLLAPLPKIITSVAIEPIFSAGFYVNQMAVGDETLSACMVATAVSDPVSVSPEAGNRGIFSSKMRHHLTCEIAQVHKLTGLGMTTGWTLLNMAFDSEYMHKILWGIPFMPNVFVFFSGLLIFVLFFMALIPVPVYFLQILVRLGMDLIMLPFMLMSWLFSGWKIFPNGGKSVRAIIDDVIRGTLGIAMIGVFLSFALILLDAVFGDWQGASALGVALSQNDPTILMDGLMLKNNSLIVIVLLGLFFAMFMTMIPQLIKKLFSSVAIPNEFYEKTKKNLLTIRDLIKKQYAAYKKE